MRMKNATTMAIVLLALNCPRPMYAAPESRIRWRGDLRTAVAEARNSEKPLLIKFSTSWCGYCKKMQRETFANKTVIAQVGQCFVPVTVDGDRSRDLTERLGIRSFPTTLIVSPRMNVVTKIAGFRTAEQLTVELGKICTQHHPLAHPASRMTHAPERSSVFGRLCPVTLVREGQAAEGKKGLSITYRGFNLAFGSESNRNEFQEHPELYWPVADGYCVVSALDEGVQRLGRLDQGLRYRGGIWLFASSDQLEQFQERPADYVQRLVRLAASKSAANRKQQ